jgi:hypothetical protein
MVGVSVGVAVSVGVNSAACSVIVATTSVHILLISTAVGVGVLSPPALQALNVKASTIIPINEILFVLIGLLK